MVQVRIDIYDVLFCKVSDAGFKLCLQQYVLKAISRQVFAARNFRSIPIFFQ
ncbi:hypothetical protein JCM19240_4785 [Vibrio maritimus]|uniref:Uncharacterized protein n=1 Tax=Vibrio maritimus TaxID=990268 RepID=A0A090T789_9VIBR|nr:hypothetical protein JCM19240_4785 [Vibrio maritimus]